MDFNQPIQHRDDVTTTGPTSFIGTVQVVIFERGLFKIISVSIEDAKFNWDQDTITVKGQLGDVVEGDRYEFEGRVVDDQRYGLQFAGTGCHVVMPQNSKQLSAYLKIHNIKLRHPRKSAQLVFDVLGENAMAKITDNPECINDIGEIVSSDREKIITFFEHLDLGNSTGEIIKKLRSFGFTERQVNVIFDKYGVKTLSSITEDPYKLATDLIDQGIQFTLVDQIAHNYYKISNQDERRLQGALLYCLKGLINSQGGSYVQKDTLIGATQRLLRFQFQADQLSRQLELMDEQQLIQIDHDQHVYETAFYDAEWKIAQKIHELEDQGKKKSPTSQKDFDKAVQDVEHENGYHYDQIQVSAIYDALNSPIMLITGGPGTGKTTIVNGIVATWLKLNPHKSQEDMMLVAPTGRAAKQINAATGIEASTIHRLLGLTADINDTDLMNMDFDELDTDLLIVDEMSMTSLALFTALISAVGEDTHVILVGDCDQLPSVGPGQVFYDLLSSNHIPQKRLTHIYRQSKDSSIIPLAHKINEGDVQTSLFAPKDANHYAHRQFFPAQMNTVADLICQAVSIYHEKHHVPLMDIQILAPIHGGPAGTQNINQVLQSNLNPDEPDKPAIQLGSRILRIGDKVMQTVNQPDKNVFNGDIGIIKSIEGQNVINGQKGSHAKQKLVVDFNGEEVEYTRLNEINALQLAYCMTIHKSQGSQAPVVIISMVNEYFPMNPNAPTIMHRNLLYTAVTRSSQALLMIGDPEAFARCANSPTEYRRTTLAKRIQQVFNGESAADKDISETKTVEREKKSRLAEVKILTPEMVEDNLIDPMIGMDGLTPQNC